MKVSPELFIQLCHRVSTLHREKEKVIESPGKKDRKVIENPSEKGKRKHCKPGSKDRVDYLICVLTSPGQRTGSIILYVLLCVLTSPGQKIGHRPEKPVT